MKRKTLKILSILILFSFDYANAMSFGNKFMSHFARIGFITKKPVSTTLLRRSHSYLKNDAIAQSKKFNSVKPSLYLGASIGTAYLFNLQLRRHEAIETVPSEPHLGESKKSIEFDQQAVEQMKQLTIEELDQTMSLKLKSFLDENEKTGYRDFRNAILDYEATLLSHPETKKIVDICKEFDLEKANQNPDELIDKLYKQITFKELPQEMSKVALEKKYSIMYRPWKLNGYVDAMKQKIQEKK
ncbi:MAG TPA: hypothetical protein VHO47_05390 [Candidatus Babeliales bacterium]|nr:hypothetical protein [Candidatus Babeliales bacterium]